MLKIAIVGYGNVGKSLLSQAKSADVQVAAVYSRRRIDLPMWRPMTQLGVQRDFDVALLALGSYRDIEGFCQQTAHLNTVDCFDTHAKIGEYKAQLAQIKRDSLAIVSVGWDPGLLSVARATFGLGANTVATLWGEGVSQGHSNAIRAIAGVIDAVQFTVPKPNALQLVAEGVTDGRLLHDRICYVACVESDRESIAEQIAQMPNYFEGYRTEVHFASPQEVRKLRQRTHHSGQVLCGGEGFEANCTVRIDNNADYTAKIMLAYAKALPLLLADGYRGAVDVLDVPLRYLAPPHCL